MVVFLLPCILDIMGLHSAHMSVGVACKWANKYAQLSPMTYAHLIHTGMERLCLRAACKASTHYQSTDELLYEVML